MIIARSLLTQLLSPFLASMAGFLVILLVNSLYNLAELLVSGSLGAVDISWMLLYLAVPCAVVAMPMSYVFASLLVLGRMGRDGEITALRAMGVGYRRIVTPVLLGGLVVSGAAYWLNDVGAPAANAAFMEVVNQAVRGGNRPMLATDVFFHTPDGRIYCFAGSVDRRTGSLSGVLIDDRRGPTRRTLTATTGEWTGEAWRLSHGVATSYDRWGVAQTETPVALSDFAIGYGLDDFFALRERGPREKPSWMLARDIALQRAAGASVRELEVEYQMKSSIPLAAFFTVLLAAPLGARLSRMGGALAVATSLALIMIYQLIMAVSNSLGVNGVVDPMTGAWLQNWVFGVLGAGLLWIVDR